MLCITANDQIDSNKSDLEHEDLDSNFAILKKKVEKNFIAQNKLHFEYTQLNVAFSL